MNTYLLIAAALIPAVILCVYIFKKDRVEKEPIALLLLLLGAGAFCCFPAIYLEKIIIGVIDFFFSGSMNVAPDGTMTMPSNVYYLYMFFKFFIGVALVEEGLKWITVIYFTRRNKNFNCLFDGLIYCVFVSLGFAALENVFYVLDYGWMNAMARAVLSVPGHMFFAVMMGYRYSMWHIADKAADMAKELKERGVIPEYAPDIKPKKTVLYSILVPVAAHGTYNFCCSVDSGIATVVFVGFVAFMYWHCFRKIGKMSRGDSSDHNYAVHVLIRKYPHLEEYIRAEMF